MQSNENNEIKIGDYAPDFELPDTNMEMVKLSDYRGTKTVLAFFPAADSPVCSKEMCNFRDSTNDLNIINAKIVGISIDGPFANKVFAEKNSLNFPLLSDYKREVIKRYGVVMKDLAKLKDYNAAKRSIFVIDENGIVDYKWVSDNPLIEPNYDEIKSVVEKKK
jgi:glutaredoxin-dependent peroxiredoxin